MSTMLKYDNINPELMKYAEGRRELTKYDPMLFALTYLPHHLKNMEDESSKVSNMPISCWIGRNIRTILDW